MEDKTALDLLRAKQLLFMMKRLHGQDGVLRAMAEAGRAAGLGILLQTSPPTVELWHDGKQELLIDGENCERLMEQVALLHETMAGDRRRDRSALPTTSDTVLALIMIASLEQARPEDV